MVEYLFQNILADQLRCPPPREREQRVPRRDESKRSGLSKARRTVLPLLEGRGEGEETLREPARRRTADGVNYSERRKTKPHARRGAESMKVASRLPPHPALSPREREQRVPRRDESKRSGLSKARRTVLPLLEGRGEGEETLREPARRRTADGVNYSERRKIKPHARRGAESLIVASRLPPHPALSPRERAGVWLLLDKVTRVYFFCCVYLVI